MFYTTDISVTAWVLSRNKKAHIEKRPEGDVTFRDRTGEILFMDLRQMGHPFEKKYIEFTEDDRKIVTDRFKAWRMEGFELPYANDIPEIDLSTVENKVTIKATYAELPTEGNNVGDISIYQHSIIMTKYL